MSKHIIVTNDKEIRSLLTLQTNHNVISFQEYINNKGEKNSRIINLCSDCSYLSSGYYVSLLAKARGQKVIPSVEVLVDLNWKRLSHELFPDLNEILEKQYKSHNNSYNFYIFFGFSPILELQIISKKIFNKFQSPILSVTISKEGGKWHITNLESIAVKKLDQEQKKHFVNSLIEYSKKNWINSKSKKEYKYYLAILFDENDKYRPSTPNTINKFIKIGESMDIAVEIINKNDYGKIGEYDALFIRETTAIDNHTYRFAKKAKQEGAVVIDDPESIIYCTNKVYLAELLQSNKIPTPKTIIFDKSEAKKIENILSYPIVLKIPDESNSKGVYKAQNKDDFQNLCQKLFKKSDLILTQEFVKTDFDWRIGVLNNSAIFACKYFMVKDHWQIAQNHSQGKLKYGEVKNISLQEVPQEVIKTALKATKLIGDGLYGVDIKQNEKGVFVIEINDNPNIEIGDEDSILQDELYKIILRDFIARIEK